MTGTAGRAQPRRMYVRWKGGRGTGTTSTSSTSSTTITIHSGIGRLLPVVAACGRDGATPARQWPGPLLWA